MNPVNFPESNITFGPPEGYDSSQVRSIKAFASVINEGNLDGDPVIVTCWEFTPEEMLEVIKNHRVFICFLSQGLPPHCAAITFKACFQD